MRAEEWSGPVGEAWAREWQRTDRSFVDLDGSLVRAIVAAARGRAPAETSLRCVDIGCGAGATSLAIARALPDAEVIGLDLSPDLVAVAVNRAEAQAEARDRCRFVVGDAVEHATGLAPVDLFFSRHGVMFFADPIAAFARLAAAATPGARLVFSCFAGVADNPWAGETLAAVAPRASEPDTSRPGPFAFADPARVGAILAAAGWVAASPERIAFRYVAGAGADPVDDALSFFRRIGPAAAARRESRESERPAALDRLTEVCRRRCYRGVVAFPAAAWLWSARAQEPAR